MNKINRYLYNIVFWVSRLCTISVFSAYFFAVLNAKYVWLENYLSFFLSDINGIFFHFNVINEWFIRLSHLNIYDTKFEYKIFGTFCKNSQNIDLLLISLFLILVVSVIIIKIINRRNKYLLLSLTATNFVVYISIYVIFRLPIMLELSIITPVIFIIMQLINNVCPMQKAIMLIPIMGEIFCTKNIIKYISKNNSENLRNIGLLIIALIVSNIICFSMPYNSNGDFKNLLINNYTYSFRTYKDKSIVSGNGELILIDKDGNDIHITNDKFGRLEDFIVNEDKKEIYIYNSDDLILFVLDAETLNIKKEIPDKNTQLHKNAGNVRLCCNNDFSKLFILFECSNPSYLVDLNTYKTSQIYNILLARDGIAYNRYRNCFLLSFVRSMPGMRHIDVLQEINIENKKNRKIKADKYQGFLAISNRNKEIYIAFYQQGRILVYDAETMKLKRKIKSNYTVKNITYDEELNVLIAPSYFTGYVDIFLMNESDKLLTREFVGYELREGCFDPQKKNLYVCSQIGLYKKKIDIKKLIEENSKK